MIRVLSGVHQFKAKKRERNAEEKAVVEGAVTRPLPAEVAITSVQLYPFVRGSAVKILRLQES